MKAKLTSLGFVPGGQCGADFGATIRKDHDKAGPSARLTYERSEHFSSASVGITEKSKWKHVEAGDVAKNLLRPCF